MKVLKAMVTAFVSATLLTIFSSGSFAMADHDHDPINSADGSGTSSSSGGFMEPACKDAVGSFVETGLEAVLGDPAGAAVSALNGIGELAECYDQSVNDPGQTGFEPDPSAGTDGKADVSDTEGAGGGDPGASDGHDDGKDDDPDGKDDGPDGAEQ